MLRYALASFTLTFAVLVLASSAQGFQTCPSPQPNPCSNPGSCPGTPPTTCEECTDVCYACTTEQLIQAINCWGQGGGCCHIIVPEGFTLNVSNQINLNNCHHCLHLEIRGTLNWTGTPGFGKILQLNGTHHVLIDGGGLLTSDYWPCQEWTGNCQCSNPPNGLCLIADGIVLLNSHHITIRNLTFTRLNRGVFASGGLSSDITMENLQTGLPSTTGHGMTLYGMYLEADDVTIRNCHVYETYTEHGYRIYGDDIIVEDSSAFDVRKTGI